METSDFPKIVCVIFYFKQTHLMYEKAQGQSEAAVIGQKSLISGSKKFRI